jgi:uncharacterized membrane protein YjgN (DUF898 family)
MRGMKLALGIAVAGILIAGSAFAQQQVVQQNGGFDQQAMQAILELQRKMVEQNYRAMLFKPQMMSKYMQERASQNYMQSSIQPEMLKKMRDQIKPLQMQIMAQNVGGSVTSQK